MYLKMASYLKDFVQRGKRHYDAQARRPINTDELQRFVIDTQEMGQEIMNHRQSWLCR